MNVEILSGPCHVDEALFGIGLSYGLTSNMKCNAAFRKSPTYKRLETVSRKLCRMQGGHNKFLETITLTIDIRAPRYWWQEFDTYRAGVTKQSESTIHTIMKRDLTDDDFEGGMWPEVLGILNRSREIYQSAEGDENKEALRAAVFDDMKAGLPEGFLQRRIVCLNLKTLQNIYHQRKNHKLPQWRMFFYDIAEGLKISPYAENVIWWTFGWKYDAATEEIEIPKEGE